MKPCFLACFDEIVNNPSKSISDWFDLIDFDWFRISAGHVVLSNFNSNTKKCSMNDFLLLWYLYVSSFLGDALLFKIINFNDFRPTNKWVFPTTRRIKYNLKKMGGTIRNILIMYDILLLV